VSASGNFLVIAEADVDSEGRFQFEDVAPGRSNLMIQALSASDVVIGSVVLKEETEAGVTHRAHPIDATSTVHAEVWMAARESGGGTGTMGAAELALFLDASAEASSGATESEIQALAEAAIEASAAITAALAAHGVSFSATARNELLATAAATRDASRDTGTGQSTSQQTYISAAFEAFVDGGIEAEVIAMAYAAATTALARGSADLSTEAQLEVTREALLLNIAVRKLGAAAANSNPLDLKTSTTVTLNALDARVRSATSTAALSAALDEERALIENRVALSVIASLPVLGGTVEALVNARTRTAVGAAQLWVRLESAANAAAMGTAVSSCTSATIAAATDLAAAVPSSAGTVDVAATTSLLLILGAGASID
jgi:hypothetical protein